MQPLNNDPRWYALHVRSRFEKMVMRNLTSRDVEVFLPLYRAQHLWSDRVKDVDLPLFPGYVFCRFNIHDRLHVVTIPGVNGVVGTGKSPVPIDDTQMHDIRSALSSGLNCEPWPFWPTGRVVEIERGPLKGVRGTIITLRKRHRLILSVNLLQRAVAVEVDEACLRPVASEQAWEPTVLV